MRCRLCNSNNIRKIFSIDSCPNISYLPKEPQIIKSIILDVYKCHDCKFIQLSKTAPIIDYDNYFMAVSFSSKMQECHKKQTENILKLINKDKTIDLLEIGCGDGGFISCLKQTNKFNITGIEPSKQFYDYAKQIHSNIHNLYLENFITNNKYDVIVAREVLEHIFDFHTFLSKIINLLNTNGLLMIQIPCLETIYKYNRIHMFFSDHVNYFSKNTLSTVLQMHNLTILKTDKNMQEEYLTVYASKNIDNDWKQIHQIWINKLNQLKNIINKALKNNKKIILWGAGGKGLSALVAMKITPKENLFLVDCDKIKIGKYTQTTNLLINNSNIISTIKPDIVIILAEAYTTEIKEKLNKFNYNGKVICIGDETYE